MRPTVGPGVEFDPLYVNVIIRRYNATTGGQAILIEIGETFEPLGARRAREAARVYGPDAIARPGQ